MNETPGKFWFPLICFTLAIVTFAAFEQVRNHDFVSYDDEAYLTQNPNVYAGLTLKGIKWAFTSPHFYMWHPITSLSHMLDCQLFGLNPRWHHLTSLMLHTANVLLLFGILRTMTGRLWPSAFVAAAFALHPLNVESVAWAAERKTVLSGLFWMLTIACYVRYAKRPGITNYLLVVLIFSLGLMSKPTTVTLPFVLLLLDYWPLNRLENISLRQPDSRRTAFRLIHEKVPFFILSAVCSTITFLVQRSGGVVIELTNLSLRFRLANATLSYVKYMEKTFWPARLAVFYPFDMAELSSVWVFVALIFLIIISIQIIRLSPNYKYLFVGWFWYLGVLVPVIGIVQAGDQAMADRYAYIPLIGLFIIIAWGLSDISAQWKYRQAVLGLSALTVTSILSICTYLQTGYWRDSRTLFEHALQVTSGNYLAHNNLGAIFTEQNQFDEAINHYRRSLEIKPDSAEVYVNLGIAYDKTGLVWEEIEAYKQALKLKSCLSQPHFNLGVIYNKLGRPLDAMEELKQTLKIRPDDAAAYYNLGIAYGKLGRTKDAMDAYRNAIKIKTDYPDPYSNIGIAYDELGRYQEAIEAYQHAIKLKPDYADPYNNLGVVFNQLGRDKEAIRAFGQAVRLKPDFAQSHYGLGISYLHAGDKDSALREYEILKKLNAQLANMLLSRISK